MTKENIIKEIDFRLLRYAEAVGTKEAPEMRNNIKLFFLQTLANQSRDSLKKIEALDKVKFSRGERKWCIECAGRIKKYLKN